MFHTTMKKINFLLLDLPRLQFLIKSIFKKVMVYRQKVEGNYLEGKQIIFSYATPRETTSGFKHI